MSRRCWGCDQPFSSRHIEQRYCTKACKHKYKPNQKPDKPPKINYSAYIISEGEILLAGNPEEIAASARVREIYLGDGFTL